jgi:tetratricopeptide (TPR) repeat protein
MGELEQARLRFGTSLSLVDAGLAAEPDNVVLRQGRVMTLRGLAETLIALGQPHEALPLLEESLRLVDQLSSEAGAATLWERMNHSMNLLTRAKALAGSPTLRVGSSRSESGGTFGSLDPLASAGQAADIARALSDADPDNFESRHLLARCRALLGELHHQSGSHEDALIELGAAVELLEALSNQDSDNAMVKGDLAEADQRIDELQRIE